MNYIIRNQETRKLLMSRISSYRNKRVSSSRKEEMNEVTNFMDGISFKCNPFDTLRMIAASSIFAEPSYYRTDDKDNKESTVSIFTKAIDDSLEFDYKKTIDYAVTLRTDYNMRLNPAVIFIRAVMHPKRKEFNQSNAGYLRKIGNDIVLRPDDLTNQFDYWMLINKTKNHLPSLIKRVWCDKLSHFNKYQLAKYQTKGLIDLVRICHAKSENINELMKNGRMNVSDEDTTWERLRSMKNTWKDIFNKIDMPHMALLRNIRGIFTEVEDLDFAKQVMNKLKEGIEYGKQFPYRYYVTRDMIQKDENSDIHHKGILMDALEECMDMSMINFPKLKGSTICLSDNSGSAWGVLTSEYGSTRIAEIDNLSSIMTAYNSDEGYVGIFGDNLKIIPIQKRVGILKQCSECRKIGQNIGGSTENGIWLFFKDAIDNKIHYDNIFIYSDMQAGHGGLYGANPKEYQEFIKDSSYIDVYKLLLKYRQTVNKNVNVFSVQTAGYDNSVLPENTYRTSILTGWTGKEVLFAQEMINIWNQQ